MNSRDPSTSASQVGGIALRFQARCGLFVCFNDKPIYTLGLKANFEWGTGPSVHSPMSKSMLLVLKTFKSSPQAQIKWRRLWLKIQTFVSWGLYEDDNCDKFIYFIPNTAKFIYFTPKSVWSFDPCFQGGSWDFMLSYKGCSTQWLRTDGSVKKGHVLKCPLKPSNTSESPR